MRKRGREDGKCCEATIKKVLGFKVGKPENMGKYVGWGGLFSPQKLTVDSRRRQKQPADQIIN